MKQKTALIFKPFCLNEVLVKIRGYILPKTVTILAIEFW